MKSIDLNEVDATLKRAVDAAASGESVIITRNGEPIARVSAISNQSRPREERLGFLYGQAKIPDDFDTLAAREIADMFEGR